MPLLLLMVLLLVVTSAGSSEGETKGKSKSGGGGEGREEPPQEQEWMVAVPLHAKPDSGVAGKEEGALLSSEEEIQDAWREAIEHAGGEGGAAVLAIDLNEDQLNQSPEELAETLQKELENVLGDGDWGSAETQEELMKILKERIEGTAKVQVFASLEEARESLLESKKPKPPDVVAVKPFEEEAKTMRPLVDPEHPRHFPCAGHRTQVRLTRNLTASCSSPIIRHNTTLPTMTADFSISFWLYLLDVAEEEAHGKLRSLFLAGRCCGLLTDGSNWYFIYRDAVTKRDMQAVGRISATTISSVLDKWVHVSVVVTQSHVALFLNGNQITSIDIIPGRLIDELNVGTALGHEAHAAHALYMDVRYSNYALEVAEMLKLMDANPPPQLPFQKTPKFDPFDFAGREKRVRDCMGEFESASSSRERGHLPPCVRTLAAHGDPDAIFNLARHLWEGYGEDVVQDVAQASFAMHAAAHLGCPSAMAYLGFFYANGIALDAPDPEKSLLWYSLAVALEDEPFALTALASKFLHGRGSLKRDCLVAQAYYARASDVAFDSVRDGTYRATQPILLADREENVDLVRDGANWEEDEVLEQERYMAEAGDPTAAAWLGDVHHNGLRNVPIDNDLAAKYYQMAADGGVHHAKVELAKMHVLGHARLDNTTVARLLNESSHLSQGVALHAHLKAHGGSGVQVDTEEALRLFKKAADMPDAVGNTFTNVGSMLRSKGKMSEARGFFLRGAARDDIIAYHWLGKMGRSREGVANTSCADTSSYFRAAVSATLIQQEILRGADCYLAQNLGCVAAAYWMAVELGSPEGADDLAGLFRREWFARNRSAFAAFAAPGSRSMGLHEDLPVDQCVESFALPSHSVPQLQPWNNERQWERHFQLEALRLGFFFSLVPLDSLALKAGHIHYWGIGGASNVSEAARLYAVAAERGSSPEALWSHGWCLEHGVGTLKNVSGAMYAYSRISRYQNSTWMDSLVGELSLAKLEMLNFLEGSGRKNLRRQKWLKTNVPLYILATLLGALICLRSLFENLAHAARLHGGRGGGGGGGGGAMR